jgi:hypothetical protein
VDPIEWPVMSFNLRKATGLSGEKADASLKVGDSFEEALILAAGRELPRLGGTAVASIAESYAAHRERFQRDASAPASHLFVIQELDAPGLPAVRVELSGGKEDLVYLFDPIRTRTEWLWSLMKSESADTDLRKYRFPAILSGQPIDRDRRDPLSSRLDLTEVDYTLTASAGNDASITVAAESPAPRHGQRDPDAGGDRLAIDRAALLPCQERHRCGGGPASVSSRAR